MLKISETAAARMHSLLTPKSEEAVLRIVRRKGRFSLRVSSVRTGDQTFAPAGRIVLALDESTNRMLAKGRLDLKQTAKGPRLNLARS